MVDAVDEQFFSDEDVMNEIVDKYEQQVEKDKIDADELIHHYQTEIEKQNMRDVSKHADTMPSLLSSCTAKNIKMGYCGKR